MSSDKPQRIDRASDPMQETRVDPRHKKPAAPAAAPAVTAAPDVETMKRIVRDYAAATVDGFQTAMVQIWSEGDFRPISFVVYADKGGMVEVGVQRKLDEDRNARVEAERANLARKNKLRQAFPEWFEFDNDDSVKRLDDILADISCLREKIEDYLSDHGRECECCGCVEIERRSEPFGGPTPLDVLVTVSSACYLTETVDEQLPRTSEWYIASHERHLKAARKSAADETMPARDASDSGAEPVPHVVSESR